MVVASPDRPRPCRDVVRRGIDDFAWFAGENFWIVPKSGREIRLRLNDVQRAVLAAQDRAIEAGRPRRFLRLKHRQPGISTLDQAVNLWGCLFRPNFRAVTISHRRETTREMFRAALMMYDRLPAGLRPRRDYESKSELDFPGLNSTYRIATAGAKAAIHGTTKDRVHCSEVARWPGSLEDVAHTMAGITEATIHGEVAAESTPHGVGNWFHATWEESRGGNGAWVPIFFPWWAESALRLPLPEGDIDAMALSDEERGIMERHSLDAEQVQWRRDAKKRLGRKFPEDYPEDDVSCFLSSGLHFFTQERVDALARVAGDPIRIEEDGRLAVWNDPESSKTYVAFGDVGEGLPDGDYSVLAILCRETGEQVARWRGRARPEAFAKKCDPLARRYNTALLAIERNNHGHSTLNELLNHLKYPKLYKHRSYDRAAGDSEKIGWPTDGVTRPLMLDGLEAAIAESGGMVVRDKVLLSEMRTFVDNGSGKFEARSGHHDDCVMAWAGAQQVRLKPAFNPSIRAF